MMTPATLNKRSLGKHFEERAEQFLVSQGYTTVTKNYYHQSSEIDLIMLSPEDILVFVEVKFRSHPHDNNFHPWESLPSKKQQHLFRAATGFLNENCKFTNHYSRYDAIIITPALDKKSAEDSEYHIEHFPDAFRETK